MATKAKTTTGLDLSRLDAALLKATLKQLKQSTGGTPEQQATRLRDHYAKHAGDTRDLVRCDACGGVSDLTKTDRCPYCGDDGELADYDEAVVETVPPEKELAVVVDMPLEKTVAALDQQVERIVALKVGTAKSIWMLGRELAGLYKTQLWKLRKVEPVQGGKAVAAYTSFEQFVRVELQMSPTHAVKLMRIAGVFSEAEVATLGTTKLGIVLTVDGPYRERLLEGAKKKSARQLKEEADTIRGKAKGDRVTVACVLGRVKVPLYKRDKKAERGTEGARVAATTIRDDPWGELELSNGVRMVFKLATTKGGEMVMFVETRRD
jgi:hypothetical protein